MGNHGAELDERPAAEAAAIQLWRLELQEQLEPLEGVWIEDKGLSLAVHYRQSKRKAETKRRILDAARRIDQARVFAGKQVINLTSPNAPHKGAALASEQSRLGCELGAFCRR